SSPPAVTSLKLIRRSGGIHNRHPGRGPRALQLDCPSGKTFSKIIFASYGNPVGDCSKYAAGSCHFSNSRRVVEKACLGKRGCSIAQSTQNFGRDPCPRIPKSLLVDALCG
ncbi:Beta-galactosidase, partial [Thalictrum thalictroides]